MIINPCNKIYLTVWTVRKFNGKS